MAGLADEAGAQAQLGGYAGDHADRQVLGLQHRPLLDMGLDIGEHLARSARRLVHVRGVQAEVEQGLAEGHARLVGDLQSRRADGLGDALAAQHG